MRGWSPRGGASTSLPFNAARSRQYLHEAAALAQRLGLLLEEAQSATTYQGYRHLKE